MFVIRICCGAWIDVSLGPRAADLSGVYTMKARRKRVIMEKLEKSVCQLDERLFIYSYESKS
jgi:hypothetical protein